MKRLTLACTFGAITLQPTHPGGVIDTSRPGVQIQQGPTGTIVIPTLPGTTVPQYYVPGSFRAVTPPYDTPTLLDLDDDDDE